MRIKIATNKKKTLARILLITMIKRAIILTNTLNPKNSCSFGDLDISDCK